MSPLYGATEADPESGPWTRVKALETNGIIGWFERRAKVGDVSALEGIVALTKGHAHIVWKGQAFMVDTPEAQFSSVPQTIMARVGRFLK